MTRKITHLSQAGIQLFKKSIHLEEIWASKETHLGARNFMATQGIFLHSFQQQAE